MSFLPFNEDEKRDQLKALLWVGIILIILIAFTPRGQEIIHSFFK